MGAHRFSVQARFKWKGECYEVIRVFAAEGKVNIQNVLTTAQLVVTIQELVTALIVDQLEFVTLPVELATSKTVSTSLDLSDFSPSQQKKARFRQQCLELILKLPPGERTRAKVIEIAKEFARTIKEQTGEAPPESPASVYRWFGKYINGGKDIRALAPHTTRRGGVGRSRLEPRAGAILDHAINELYWKREHCSLDDLLQEVAVRIDEENRLHGETEKLTCPSYSTIRRRVAALDVRDRFAARKGRWAARRQFKQFGQRAAPKRPFEEIEMDSTRPDLIIIDDEDDLPLGRVTLTLARCVLTKYPAGYQLGWEPPSGYTTAECLYHTILPKLDVRKRFGTQHEWLAYGIPNTLIVDNGPEFANRSLEDACASLGIQLRYAPVRMPEYRGGIERLIGTLETMLIHKIPGTTFSNPEARGDYESEKEAVVFLSEFERMINIFMVDVYAERPHKGLEGGIPARRWEDALRPGFLPRLPTSAKDLLVLLGRVEYRVIHHYGIELFGLRYNASELGLVRNRLNQEPAKIKFHPGDLSKIHVYDPFQKIYLEIPALDHEGYTQNLSLWKHRVIRNWVLGKREKPDLVALGKAKREIRDIIRDAKGRKRERGRSKAARFEGTPPSLRNAPDGLPAPAFDQPAQPNFDATVPPSDADVDEGRQTHGPASYTMSDDQDTDDEAWGLGPDLPGNHTD